MTTQAASAMDLEFAQAGVNPHDIAPLLGRRAWTPAYWHDDSGGIHNGAEASAFSLSYSLESLGASIVLDRRNADLVILPDAMEYRQKAHFRTAASRQGVPVLFTSHIDALIAVGAGLCISA